MTPKDQKEFNRLINKILEGEKEVATIYEWVNDHVEKQIRRRIELIG